MKLKLELKCSRCGSEKIVLKNKAKLKVFEVFGRMVGKIVLGV